jgi:hypothetical protein
MAPQFPPSNCSHVWAEANYVELGAALDYWCEGDPRCRMAKQQAILSACENGVVNWIRADGRTFEDHVRELAARNLVLIERASFETWAAAINQKTALPLSMSTRETNSLRRQVAAMALLLAKRDRRYGKDDGTPSANAIADDIQSLLDELDQSSASWNEDAHTRQKVNRSGVSSSTIRQNITEGMKELLG